MQQKHKSGSVRHAEKRRTGTCQFADRVALVSIQAFNEHIPKKWRDENKQVCLATIVAHFRANEDEEGKLLVLGLGVGTKYVLDEIIDSDTGKISSGAAGTNNNDAAVETPRNEEMNSPSYYGMRIRDSHAEVLARRAFRRKLTLEMKSIIAGQLSSDTSILHYDASTKDAIFSLVDGVTIHMYTSSTPCGNSCLKKFSKMTKEKFNTCLGADEWPKEIHEPIPAHSLHLGNFSLLVKRDYSSTKFPNLEKDLAHIPKKQRKWPANVSDDWCPPGTSLPHLGKGSIHTCSDKICRWNYLGLQGSFLSSLLERPIYMDSLTVGRKFTKVIAQRAVCCRAACGDTKKSKRKREEIEDEKEIAITEPSLFKLNHPAICGTGVYFDDAGVLDMSGDKIIGQDVRFRSALCWIWCPSNGVNERFDAECIDGETGFLHAYNDSETTLDCDKTNKSSAACTYELAMQFIDVLRSHGKVEEPESSRIQTLDQLRLLKRNVSSKYETAKDDLLQNHAVFKLWNRRDNKR